MGLGDYTFDPAITASYARGLIGRAMDVRVASQLIEDCARYLQPVRLATGVVPQLRNVYRRFQLCTPCSLIELFMKHLVIRQGSKQSVGDTIPGPLRFL